MHRSRRALATGLVAAAVLALLGAVPVTAQDPAAVTVGEFFYDSFDTVVVEGTTVRWTNHGSVTHSVTDSVHWTNHGSVTDSVQWTKHGSVTDSVDRAFDVVLNPGETFEFTFEQPGEVNYFCKFHGAPSSGQNGWVTVHAEGAPAPDPRPTPATATVDLPASADNVAAALTVTSLLPDGTAPTVLLGRDDDFADLLAAGASGLPLLLTATAQLDDRLAAELQRLGTQTVFVVGGQQAVSDAVVDSLEEMGITVQRIAGATRLETAVAIAQQFFPAQEGREPRRLPASDKTTYPPPPPPPQALIARARGTGTSPTAGFADSLGASAVGARLGIPVLVVDDVVPQAVADYLLDAGIDYVAIVGGRAAVPLRVAVTLQQLGISSIRAAGASREITAAELFRYVQQFRPPPGNVFVVDGFQGDAWAAGFGAAALDSGVLLTNGDSVPEHTLALLVGRPHPAIAVSNLVCGTNVTDVACGTAIAAVTVNFRSPDARAAVLVGAEEPDGGAADGNGLFVMVPVDGPTTNTLCYHYTAVLVDSPLIGAHIHQGAEGVNGPIVVPLSTYGIGEREASGCATRIDDELFTDLLADPGSYYVNVHTEQFPLGAIRDQLFTPDGVYVADMSGDQEVGAEGDPLALGSALLLFDGTNLCFQMAASGLQSPATAAHVHTGGPQEAGPVLVDLQIPYFEGPPQGPPPPPTGGSFAVNHHGCVEAGEHAQKIKDNPTGHYLNVHTRHHPDGAIRGQLNELIPPRR